MIILALALLAAPTAPQSCDLHGRVVVTGTVATLNQAPAAPFDQIAVGDPLHMSLTYSGDLACTTPGGLYGTELDPVCSDLTIGSSSGSLDPGPMGTCLWGESYSPGTPSYTELVLADVPFGNGALRAVVEIFDSQGLVGIGLSQLSQNSIDVASVTAPGFAVMMTLVDSSGVVLASIEVTELDGWPPTLFGGLVYCTSLPNSTGSTAKIGAAVFGPSPTNFELRATELPLDSFGYFLVSSTTANIPLASGVLCVGGEIGRFIGPGQLQFSGGDGYVRLDVDRTNLPQPTGPVSAQAGETWNFTYWYRDFTTVLTSNLSNGLSVTFQ